MLETPNVASKRLGVSKQKMGKQDRLRMLHMRHPRHGNVEVGFHLLQKGVEQSLQDVLNLPGSVDDEQTEIGGHKFVAAAAGMQLPPERAKFLDQRFFDEVVHVFRVGPQRFEPSGIRLGPLGNLLERPKGLLHFGRGKNADGLQSFGPGTINGNLIWQETAIEPKRALEPSEVCVRCALEASSPQPVVFAFGHMARVARLLMVQPRTLGDAHGIPSG